MPTSAAVHLAIENRFETLWTDQNVTLRFEEDSKKKPSGPFIRLNIRGLRSSEKGFSGAKVLYRRPAFITMQCFVQVGTGTQAARVMADAAVAIFEGQTFSSISCGESEVREVGDDKKGFWQVNAIVYFDFDEEVTVT